MIPEIWSRIDILSFSAIVCSFTPITQKIKNLKKWKKNKKKKKHLELSSFYKFTKNHMLCSQDMVYGRCNCFILGYFLPFYPTNSQKNQII